MGKDTFINAWQLPKYLVKLVIYPQLWLVLQSEWQGIESDKVMHLKLV